MHNLRNTILTFLSVSLALLPTSGARAQSPTDIDMPIMGWSSWNTYRVHISDSLIRKQADAMVRLGLKDAGYQYVNVDDGFFGCRDEHGVLRAHPQRFPDGMKPLVDYIHGLGLKAGIYSDAGANTCGSLWDADPHGVGVGLYGHEAQDARLFFNQWGFDFIKIDYCGAGQQLELDERERYVAIHDIFRKVCERDISINICRWAFPGTWARDIARSWRVSPDIAPRWSSVKDIIRRNLYLSAYAGGGHYNDMDMLEIGRGLTPNEEEVHFAMWCLMSSPLLIGCDLTTIPEASLRLLKNKELIAINQDGLGLQAYVAQHEGEGYVLVKDIEESRGKTRAVALYNPSDTVCDFNVPLELLELSGKVKARDLILRRNAGVVEGTITRRLAPHSVCVLRLEAEERLEPVRYEAEWAYLPLYDALGKRARGIGPVPRADASGGMVVSNIGGSPDNYAEWNNVYSREGGTYDMTITYLTMEEGRREVNDRMIEVEVNGKRVGALKRLDREHPGSLRTVTLPVTLEPGDNVVRIGSPYTWTPDIDCFTLERR